MTRSNAPISDNILAKLKVFKGHFLPVPRNLERADYRGKSALIHLMEVANGMKSQIIGDVQVDQSEYSQRRRATKQAHGICWD